VKSEKPKFVQFKEEKNEVKDEYMPEYIPEL
jgi:hypothetical protein